MASFSDIQYPIARRVESVVDDYHGVSIADPYRWLEDPEAKEVKEFVEKQTSLTESILGQCETREDLRRSIKNLFNHPRFTTPFNKGNKYFYSYNSGLHAQSVLYVQNGLEEEAEVLFDPNKLSEDGTIALAVKSMSEDAKYMAYALSSSGSDWLTIKVKFSNIGWTHDGKGFFYSRYPAPKEGTFSDAGTETNVNLNHEYLLLSIRDGAGPVEKLYYCDLSSIEHGLKDVLPESESDVLESANAVNGNQLLVCYLSDVKRKDNEFFINFTGFLTSGVIYKFKLESGIPEMEIFREIIVPGFDKAEFEAKQVFFPSKDGTKIPMFVVSKKDIQLDGSHPLLLHGYGGFSISLTPYFDVVRTVLMRYLGVVFCLANIRGGGEYGEEWHKAGSLSRKQNCFDDFISAAEYLVSAGYTQPNKLCIEGGSNGGILVGACINQRPDLFGCALASVGVMDMLRFHKFTIGYAWTSEFGCSDKEEEFNWLIKYSPLHNVKRPWEQINNDQKKNLQYPATMLLTADHDDRVVPLHSLKLLAIDEAADQYSFMAKMLGVSWIN
ncbi:hypothetical protein QJS10_CPB15g01019 [Acorus calamus]|uniref:Prolyl endopeptidase n=1 Tax=Acorus calamus TaxID=4465 RepID=A0AAV9D949_ACOCL|nr:hypothetical protein QJS10_CPB15g01019 [Acorus calamus]